MPFTENESTNYLLSINESCEIIRWRKTKDHSDNSWDDGYFTSKEPYTTQKWETEKICKNGTKRSLGGDTVDNQKKKQNEPLWQEILWPLSVESRKDLWRGTN